MSAEERKEIILEAALPLFARKGFKGTTTKELAKAAKISEALLYQHFPSKTAIWEELQGSCGGAYQARLHDTLSSLQPSTSTLVHMAYFMVRAIFVGIGNTEEKKEYQQNIRRIMITSIMGDGQFAKGFLQNNIMPYADLIERSIQAARESGDIRPDWIPDRCCWWFVHHLAVTLGMFLMPEEPVIDYQAAEDVRLIHAVRFALRGMGMSDHAIDTIFNPEAFEMLSGQLSMT